MNYKNNGADKRHKLSLRHGADTQHHRMAGHFGAPTILTRPELRRLVAEMVD